MHRQNLLPILNLLNRRNLEVYTDFSCAGVIIHLRIGKTAFIVGKTCSFKKKSNLVFAIWFSNSGFLNRNKSSNPHNFQFIVRICFIKKKIICCVKRSRRVNTELFTAFFWPNLKWKR